LNFRTEPRKSDSIARHRRRLHMLRGTEGFANWHSQEDGGHAYSTVYSGSDSRHSDRDEVSRSFGMQSRRREFRRRGEGRGRGGEGERKASEGRGGEEWQEDEERGEQEGSSRSIERKEGIGEARRSLCRRRCERHVRLHSKLQ